MKALIILFIPFYCWADLMLGTAQVQDEIIYTETHEISFFDSKKSVISKMITNYHKDEIKIGFREQEFFYNHYMPNVVFRDDVNNETYSITVNGTLGLLKSFLNGIEKTLEFKIKKDLVATDSISKYIYENFDRLLVESLNVKCLFPRSQSFVSITIKVHKVVGDEVTFVIQPSSLLFKLFASKTYITLDKKTKNWTQYIGFSNLKNNKGEIPEVIINYRSKSIKSF